jgi:hypothetical protein
VQHFIERNNGNPVTRLSEDLSQAWDKSQTKAVEFSIFARIGMKTTMDDDAPGFWGNQKGAS